MANADDIQRQVEANFRWSFAVNILEMSFFTLGMNLVSRETIIPLLVSQLTGSKMAIGLIPAIHSLGFLGPQLLSANLTERMRRKKPFVILVSGLGERGSYLLIGLAVLWLAELAPTVALVALYLFLAVSAASGGIATPAWFDVIAKVIPERRRGVFFGTGHGMGALLSVAGAALAGWTLTGWPFPRNFGLCFVLAFVVLAISGVVFALNREPETLTVKPHISLGHYLRQLPNVLRRDRNYARYLISRSVVMLGGMAGGFFMVYGSERFTVGGHRVGTLTAVLVGTQAAMNLLWGVMGGKRGHKAVLCGAALSMMLAATVTWLASSPLWLLATFALLGASRAGDSVSGMSIILEFCAPEDRPTYVGLTNTLLAPVKASSPIIGGWLATWASYRGMFVVALTISMLGAILLALWVREPRRVAAG